MRQEHRHSRARGQGLAGLLPGLVLGFLAGVLVTWALLPRANAAQAVPDGGQGYQAPSSSAAFGLEEEAGAAPPEASPQQEEAPWYLALVNFENPIDPGYEPELATLADSGLQFDARAAGALEDMLEAMKAQGLSPVVCSAYRTQQDQEILYQNQVEFWQSQGLDLESARQEASLLVARPGTSEHQLGLAADIVAQSYQLLDQGQEYTAEQQWLLAHCQEYGFILRYPTGKTGLTGVSYEPWHYRYVGQEAAREIMAQGVCLEEYLAR